MHTGSGEGVPAGEGNFTGRKTAAHSVIANALDAKCSLLTKCLSYYTSKVFLNSPHLIYRVLSCAELITHHLPFPLPHQGIGVRHDWNQ